MSDKPKKTDLLEDEGPGVGPQKKIPAIEKAAEKYRDIRDQRMELTKQEVESKAVLANIMQEHSLTQYTYNATKIICEPGKLKVKVKAIDADDDEEEGEE